MIWAFKQQLYVSQRRVALAAVQDLSNPAIRAQIQDFITSQGKRPVMLSLVS